jgi:formylglycine-generating enzyme required for sulfatase activity
MWRTSILFLVCVILAGEEKTAKRLALIIANSAYQHLDRIPEASSEATLMESALRDIKFDISRVSDMKWPGFQADEAAFLGKVHPGDICVVYFTGYAVQGEDDNYLLPVNFDPRGSGDLSDRAYHLARLQQYLESRGAALKIFLLESARRLPPIPGITGIGLQNQSSEDSKETLFAFSAPLFQTVPAHSGEIGAFTKAVVKDLEEPGLGLSDFFAAVKREVAQGPTHQVPAVADNVTQQFFFRPKQKEERRAGAVATNRLDRLEYVWIPPGRFKIGCVPRDTRCENDEKPQHDVTITNGFWLGRTEVDVNAYRRYVEDGRSQKLRMPAGPVWDSKWHVGNNPIVNVRWDEAASFCRWTGGRLPTEAEWEYAARAGVEDEVVPLNDENSRDKANFAGRKGNDHYDNVAPVKSFDPNPWNLYDMSGNVWEWVFDFYSPSYYKDLETPVDPQGPPSGKEHVARGGSWDSDPQKHLRLSLRQKYGKGGNTLGVRCALPDNDATKRQLILDQPGR